MPGISQNPNMVEEWEFDHYTTIGNITTLVKSASVYLIPVVKYSGCGNINYSALFPLQIHCNYTLGDISRNIPFRDLVFS